MNEIDIQLILSILTLGGVIFAIYKYFRDPDIKADKSIDLIKKECTMKHGYIDKDISKIFTDLNLIKENHIKHIEDRMDKIENNITKIFTILDERLPKK
jgi:hypothetical protein